MSRELLHVMRVTGGTDGAAVWLDTGTMRFVVSPANGEANGAGVQFIPLADYLQAHPEYRPAVETSIRDRLTHGFAGADDGRPSLEKCRGLLDAKELNEGITPETVHEEIPTGPPVGHEEW